MSVSNYEIIVAFGKYFWGTWPGFAALVVIICGYFVHKTEYLLDNYNRSPGFHSATRIVAYTVGAICLFTLAYSDYFYVSQGPDECAVLSYNPSACPQTDYAAQDAMHTGLFFFVVLAAFVGFYYFGKGINHFWHNR
jgi:hypothetical protein